MTDLWDSEAAEYLDDEGAEWYDESAEDVDFGDSDLFGEAKSEAQKRREAAQRRRKQQLEIQRRASAGRRQAPARPMTATAAIKNTRTAVRREHLTNQVRADAFGGAVTGLRRRTTGLEKTVSAAAVTNTIKNELDRFSGEDERLQDITTLLKTIVDFVPLAFVRSDAKGFYRNPPVVAAGVAGAVAITGLIIDRLRDDSETGNGVGGNALAAPRSGQNPPK